MSYGKSIRWNTFAVTASRGWYKTIDTSRADDRPRLPGAVPALGLLWFQVSRNAWWQPTGCRQKGNRNCLEMGALLVSSVFFVMNFIWIFGYHFLLSNVTIEKKKLALKRNLCWHVNKRVDVLNTPFTYFRWFDCHLWEMGLSGCLSKYVNTCAHSHTNTRQACLPVSSGTTWA